MQGRRKKGCIGISIFIIMILISISVITYFNNSHDSHAESVINDTVENNKNISLENESDSESEPINTESSTGLVRKEIYLERSGYCHNPELNNGPSKEILTFDWEEITEDIIVKQLFINYTFIAEDDHYGSLSDEDTGDIFMLTDVLYNKTNGEEEYRGGVATFPGECSAACNIHLQNITGGIGLLPKFQLEIEISNCGEYPLYWKLGIFSEPDPGNEWKLELTYSYLTYK